jgi:hypothetical protein
MDSPFTHKNMYAVLCRAEKSVSFSDQVLVVDAADFTTAASTKDWDGSSATSILYANLIYDFMMTHGLTLSERSRKISIAMSDKSTELMTEFLAEAENTCSKLTEPGVKKVPLWRKGGSHKKMAFSLPTGGSSIVWVQLFSDALKKTEPKE